MLQTTEVKSSQSVKIIGFIAGLVLFGFFLLLPAPEGLSVEAWRTAAITVLISIWWMTEPIPIPITSLLPIILFPLLGVGNVSLNASAYAHPMIFLFMGGFMIALAMQRWNLHRRIALKMVRQIGTQPRSIIAGFMISTAILSCWISNTAATLMMLPVALSVVELVPDEKDLKTGISHGQRFTTALLLGLAYSASIGGLGTLIGTPTNTFLVAFLNEQYGFEISFVQWLMIGIPFVIFSLPLAFLVLTRVAFPVNLPELPGGKQLIESEIVKMGRISRPEVIVATVFVLTALLWISRPYLQAWLPGLSDTGIALLGATVLFAIPIDLKKGQFIMNWEWALKLPWGVLLLFGGGLSLAAAISRTGLAAWVGGVLGAVSNWPLIILIALAVMLIIFMTELASNTATAAAFLPILASVAAVALGENPLLLVVPATLAASCAFMLPAATPPNAIVYGSEKLTIQQMARGGLLLNLLFVLLVTIAVYALVIPVLGITFGEVPAWAS
ncbi:MAG: DASS family sodium-coupled anion symporter [Rhodothermales bacterium]